MNELKIFENIQFGQLRGTMRDGEPWFVAADVCKALEIQNVTQALERLDEDERAMFNIGRQGETNIISEGGLWALVLGSRKPEAKAFKRWITHEVIPAIRMHGAYMTTEKLEAVMNDPDAWIALLQTLKRERTQRKALEAQAEQDRPKVLFADSVSVSDEAILVGELAKILKGNGVDIGQNRMFERLRQDGYLIKRRGTDYNAPTQKAMELGLFKIKETAITHADGHVTISITTKVTGKGQQYFVNRFMAG